MPRVTFHGCSPNHPLYPEFEKYQLRHPIRGHKLGYELDNPTYDSPDDPNYNYPTAYINPASKEFRKYVVAQMKTLYETYPIDALHLDINTSVVNNPPINGLTSAQGNVLLHQELAAAMPGIVLGGENVHEVTFFNTNLAQRWSHDNKQPHPISSFLFLSWTIPYGFHVPNPDGEPELYQAWQEAYVVWGVLPTIRIRAPWMLRDQGLVRTHGFLRSVRKGQSWEQTWNIDIGMDIVGDVNKDGVVNVLEIRYLLTNLFLDRRQQRQPIGTTERMVPGSRFITCLQPQLISGSRRNIDLTAVRITKNKRVRERRGLVHKELILREELVRYR